MNSYLKAPEGSLTASDFGSCPFHSESLTFSDALKLLLPACREMHVQQIRK